MLQCKVLWKSWSKVQILLNLWSITEKSQMYKPKVPWNATSEIYTKLVDWYNDSFIYHYLGFITVSGLKSLVKIIIDSKGKTKEELEKYLIELIHKEFTKKGENDDKSKFYFYELENLSYKKYYPETKKILLLHNVLYYTSNMAHHKFPFELFVKEDWSIEHIIPQNPKDISDVEIYKQWYIDILSFNETDVYDQIINQLKNYTSIEDINSDKELKFLLNKFGFGTDLDKMPDEVFKNLTTSTEKGGSNLRQFAKELTGVRRKKYMDGRLGMIIDGTGDDYAKIADNKSRLEAIGYDCYMVFINTSMEIALDRNNKRARKLPADIVKDSWNGV